jgi:hypothetical protein
MRKIMIVTRKSLPRRTMLRGIGATLALPLLDAMLPALSATARAGKPNLRLGFFYVPNGVTMQDWHPTGSQTDFTLAPILRAMAPFQDQMVVIRGLANHLVEGLGGGPHTRCGAAWLCGVEPKRTEGADIQLATTIDQHAARELGRDTLLPSLELAIESNYIVGNCDNGYSCVYQNTFSWRTPTTPLPMENNPRVVFERLFGDGGSKSLQLTRLRQDRSILDAVGDDMTRLVRGLGTGDRVILTEYLDAVREVETRIQKAEQHNATAPVPAIERPLGIPMGDDEHAKLMFDLQFLAYQADVTRVVSFLVAREQSQRTYPYIGVPNGHHDMSHHQNNPEKMAQNSKINAYHVSLLARLVERMRATPDGDGSLLDHAMLLYGSGMGEGDIHSPHDLPTILVGGGCGTLRGGRYLTPPANTPLMNLGLSLLDKAGVELDAVGDSTGRLADL